MPKKQEIIKKSEIEKRKEAERRAEIQMLQVFVFRYPEKTKEFLEQIQKNSVDIKDCIS